MLQKNVTAVAYVGDNSRNFEYQKRYQRILYKYWLIENCCDGHDI